MYPLEEASVHALGIVSGLQEERRNIGEYDRRAHALHSVFPQVARHFAATHREADERAVMQVQFADKFVQVLGERVVVIAGGWLAGLAESPAVVGDHAVACFQKNGHLLFPGGAAEWISVNQNNGLAGAVVLIIKVD